MNLHLYRDTNEFGKTLLIKLLLQKIKHNEIGIFNRNNTESYNMMDLNKFVTVDSMILSLYQNNYKILIYNNIGMFSRTYIFSSFPILELAEDEVIITNKNIDIDSLQTKYVLDKSC